MDEETAKQYFPDRVHKGNIQPNRLKYLIMAPPKWGKTTLFTGVPNCLLLAFEEGHMFAECHKIVITGWDVAIKDRGPAEDEEGIKYATALEVVDALEAYNPYDFIVIDTVDNATKLCTDYECKRAGVQHPSEVEWTGWDMLQTSPFRRFYNRIVKLGVGIACTTHIKESWQKDRFGQEQFRRETSLPSGIQKFIHAQSDVIINGLFGRRRKTLRDRDRIISFDGTNEIMAGTRIRNILLPNKYIVAPPTTRQLDAAWLQWQDFFAKNPQAGQAAEDFYLKTLHGNDNEPEQDEPPQRTDKIVREEKAKPPEADDDNGHPFNAPTTTKTKQQQYASKENSRKTRK